MTKNTANFSDYRSYLMRLWRSDRHGRTEWTVMLEDPRTGERHGFESLETMKDFLKAELGNDLQGQAR